MASFFTRRLASTFIRLSHKARFQLSAAQPAAAALATQKIHVLGLFQGSTGGVAYVTISGPGQDQTIKEAGNFDLPLDLGPGTYKFYISAFTDGTFTVNITGTIQNVNPTLPYTFPSNYDVITLTV